MDYTKLKSGTDVRGTAMGAAADLTAQAVRDIVCAFAVWLDERGFAPKVAVGRDSRLTGEELLGVAADALTSSGVEVLDCGMCSTPSMFMMTQYPSTKCGGAIMVTASHHPSDKNGLKFFTPKGGLSSAELGEVLRYASELKRKSGAGKRLTGDYLGLYCEQIKAKINGALPSGLKGFSVVVDAGSGAGGFFAKRILEPLGADVSGSQFLEPDGNFPFHRPNPEDKAAMDSISAKVKATGADLGIIFDTDVDRSAIVTASGAEINRNRLIALISDIILRDNAGGYIVTDSVTSDGLTEFIASRGGNHIRYKRGYRNVIEFAEKLTAEGKCAPLAIETSGHAAFRDNYYLDDGAYLAVMILIEAVRLKRANKTLDSLIADLKEPVEQAEVRLKLGGDFKKLGETILSDMESWARSEYAVVPSYEGVRVNTPWGFFMARMSVHDPIMPVNIECNASGGVSETARILSKFLSRYDLDISDIERLVIKGE